MDGNANFAQWLKKARQKQDLTQEELALRLGYSVRTIQKLETGERRPSREVAELIARFFGLPESEHERFIRFARPTAGHVPGAQTAAESFPVHNAWPQMLDRIQRSLPHPNTSLVGRDEEAAEVIDMVRDPTARIVTLTGPAGIGKTRLAIHVAEQMIAEFDGGIYFVELASVRDPALVLPAIARTVGARELLGRSLVQTIESYFHGKRSLLVLDNFEQVVEGSARVAPLLAGLRDLKVIVTTREVLHLSMEHVYQVPPLAVPSLSYGHGSQSAPSSNHLKIAQVASVRMFEQRARTVAPHFAITPSNAVVVAEICRKLEGLPLALELAAARIKVASPEEILRRLRVGTMSLATPARDTEQRQQSLNAAIEWSYRLLTEPEKQLFRQLAVFSGSFSMKAAEQVCKLEQQDHPSAAPTAPLHVMDGVQALLDKSLLHESFGGPGDHSFRMLEMVREFAEARLRESGRLTETHTRHAAYYLDLAESAAPWMVTREQTHWLDVLEAARDNLRAAHDWFADNGHWQEALRLAGALVVFWLLRGYATEGRQLLQIALGVAPPPRPATVHLYTRALWGIGVLAGEQGDYPAGRLRLQESVRLAERVKDDEGLARALATLGLVALGEGRAGEAREHLERSIGLWSDIICRPEASEEARWGHAVSLTYLGMVEQEEGANESALNLFSESLMHFRLLGSRWGTALALTCLGNVHYWRNEFTAAQPLYEESVRHLRQIEGHGSLAWVLATLGHIALRNSDWSRGESLYREALNLHRTSHGNKLGVAYTLNGLGEIARTRGDYARAIDLYDQSLALFREMEDERGAGWMLHNIGAANYLRGNLTRAGAFYREALPVLLKHDVTPGISSTLAGLAGVAAGRVESGGEDGVREEAIRQAAILLGAANALLAARSAQLEPVDRAVFSKLVADIRQAAGEAHLPAQYAAWEVEGRQMPLKDAVRIALASPVGPTGGPEPLRSKPEEDRVAG